MNASFCWSANTGVPMCRRTSENVSNEFVLVYFTCMVYKIGGKWPYSCCFVMYYFKDPFKEARGILKIICWWKGVVRPKLACIMDSSSTVLLCEITLSGSIIQILHLSSCRVALPPAVFTATRIWPSVSRYLEISFGLRGPSPGFYLLRGGGSSPGTWGESRRGRRHFWECRARVGFGPAPEPT